MPGPSPGMTRWARSGRVLSIQRPVKIVPLGVKAVDEAHLPGARPVLHGLLALDGVADVLEALVPDEAPEGVPCRSGDCS